jgi:hypothetical protein
MTLPMPPNFDGPVPDFSASLEARSKQQAAKLDEHMRKDLSNGNVSQGGRLRVLHNNGATAVTMGTDPATQQNRTALNYDSGLAALRLAPGAAVYGSKHQLTVWDIAGKIMLSTDEAAGFGLSNPGFTYGLWGQEALSAGVPTSAGAAVVMAQGLAKTVSPSWYVGARIRVANGVTGFTLNTFFQSIAADGTVTTSGVLSSVIGTNVLQIINLTKVMPLRLQDMNAMVTMYLKCWVTGSDATMSSAQAFPTVSMAGSQALYDLNPTFH